MKTVIAIDPGKQGALAVYFGITITTHKLPKGAQDRVALLRHYLDASSIEGWPVVCVMERVGGYVGRPQPGSRMFVFGECFGFLLGVIHTLQIPLVLVRPQEWQRALGLGRAKDHGSGHHWKGHLKFEAQRLFPRLRVIGQTSDALLILQWALRAGHGEMKRASSEERGA